MTVAIFWSQSPIVTPEHGKDFRSQPSMEWLSRDFPLTLTLTNHHHHHKEQPECCRRHWSQVAQIVACIRNCSHGDGAEIAGLSSWTSTSFRMPLRTDGCTSAAEKESANNAKTTHMFVGRWGKGWRWWRQVWFDCVDNRRELQTLPHNRRCCSLRCFLICSFWFTQEKRLLIMKEKSLRN